MRVLFESDKILKRVLRNGYMKETFNLRTETKLTELGLSSITIQRTYCIFRAISPSAAPFHPMNLDFRSGKQPCSNNRKVCMEPVMIRVNQAGTADSEYGRFLGFPLSHTPL